MKENGGLLAARAAGQGRWICKGGSGPANFAIHSFRRPLKLRTFRIAAGQSVTIGGLARIDVLEVFSPIIEGEAQHVCRLSLLLSAIALAHSHASPFTVPGGHHVPHCVCL